MTQTLAIFHDAYRSLNARKMFWMVLILSGLVVGAFAFVGINEQGLNIFFWQFEHEFLNSDHVSPALLYKWIFVEIGISIWLSWIAAILALVSTAGIFPGSSGALPQPTTTTPAITNIINFFIPLSFLLSFVIVLPHLSAVAESSCYSTFLNVCPGTHTAHPVSR